MKEHLNRNRLTQISVHSTFHCGVKGSQRMTSISVKTLVHGFGPKSENFDFGKKRIPYERASQEEQNGANFSCIPRSSREL